MLFHADVEIIVHGLGQIHEQRIGDVPHIGDGVVGVDGKDEVSAGGVYDACVAGVADNAITGGDVSVFVWYESPIWYAALDQRAKFVLCHEINQQLTGLGFDFVWECCNQRAASVFGALIQVRKQRAHFGWGGLRIRVGVAGNVSSGVAFRDRPR